MNCMIRLLNSADSKKSPVPAVNRSFAPLFTDASSSNVTALLDVQETKLVSVKLMDRELSPLNDSNPPPPVWRFQRILKLKILLLTVLY